MHAIKPKRKRICVSLHLAFEHQRSIFLGIKDYARRRRDWELLLISIEGRVAGEVEVIKDVAGVIGYFSSHGDPLVHLQAAQAAAGKCVVGVRGRDPISPIPRVFSDNLAVGRMAADYLLSLHYQHFAFLELEGPRPYLSMDLRLEGFSSQLARLGFPCEILTKKAIYADDYQPKPHSAILVFNILGAREFIEILAKKQISVPEEVAVIAVDRDNFIQQISPVSISTVAQNSEAIGYAAAELMQKLLQGEQIDPGYVKTIPPLGIDTGTSTEVLAYDDPVIRKALDLLRHNLGSVHNVAKLADMVGASRSTLERRFRDQFNCTVRDFLQQRRIEMTMALLRDTDMRVAEIAETVGFGDPRMLSVVFNKATGTTPRQFRKRAHST